MSSIHHQSLRVRDELRSAVDRRAARDGLTRAEAWRRALAEWAGDPELAEMPSTSRAGAALRGASTPSE